MDAVRRGDTLLQQVLRRFHVGGDHAFLDQLVGIVALEHPRLGDLAAVVQHEPDLGRFELDRTALLARLRQHLVQLVQALHLRQLRADLPPGLLVVHPHRVPDLGIGQARV